MGQRAEVSAPASGPAVGGPWQARESEQVTGPGMQAGGACARAAGRPQAHQEGTARGDSTPACGLQLVHTVS
jgi:hypothetical protein